MTILQLYPARTRKSQSRDQVPPMVSAERVREMLLEIAFVLHATRVVGRMDEQGTEADVVLGGATASRP